MDLLVLLINVFLTSVNGRILCMERMSTCVYTVLLINVKQLFKTCALHVAGGHVNV